MDPQTPIALAIVALCAGLFVWRQARGLMPRRSPQKLGATASGSTAAVSGCKGCQIAGSCSKPSC